MTYSILPSFNQFISYLDDLSPIAKIVRLQSFAYFLLDFLNPRPKTNNNFYNEQISIHCEIFSEIKNLSGFKPLEREEVSILLNDILKYTITLLKEHSLDTQTYQDLIESFKLLYVF